jgi:hypothetical protein
MATGCLLCAATAMVTIVMVAAVAIKGFISDLLGEIMPDLML